MYPLEEGFKLSDEFHNCEVRERPTQLQGLISTTIPTPLSIGVYVHSDRLHAHSYICPLHVRLGGGRLLKLSSSELCRRSKAAHAEPAVPEEDI